MFREFVAQHVETHAPEWDRAQKIPEAVVNLLAEAGYLGSTVPMKFDGQGWDTVTFGLLNEAFGRGSAALTDLLTVQAMVSMTVLKWGRDEQKSRWLPALARGRTIGAFALTEPSGGSDLQSLQTQFTEAGDGSYRLNGQKTWISYGQTAGVFLIVGTVGPRPLACLLPRETPGLTIEPITGMMGFRAAGLARLTFHDVAISTADVLGKPGTALSYIAPVGLQYGRISTACSSLGLLRGCFEEAASRAASRKVGTSTVGQLGMIRSLLAKMGTDVEAAALLCLAACRATDRTSPRGFPPRRSWQPKCLRVAGRRGRRRGRRANLGRRRMSRRRPCLPLLS